MEVSMDKNYTLDGEVFIILTMTKPGGRPIVGYTPDGGLHTFDIDGSNFRYQLVEVSPYADFVIDEPVMVRDTENKKWLPRHFAGAEGDTAAAWDNGATKWGFSQPRTFWLQCRRPTAEELAT